ncbi:MAG: hypothetical protein HQL13_04795, partial [Candidatus Omnitrophica bacterium]|nr:hypothetical protein [Candidatus Omnitrophota bacterium]
MKITLKFFSFLILLSLLFLQPVSSYAWWHGHGHGHGHVSVHVGWWPSPYYGYYDYPYYYGSPYYDYP